MHGVDLVFFKFEQIKISSEGNDLLLWYFRIF